MPTKRTRTPRGGRLSAETQTWLDSDGAKLFFTKPDEYAKLTRPPRAVCHLPEVRPWWVMPDSILRHLRGTFRPYGKLYADAVKLVKLLEAEWNRRQKR